MREKILIVDDEQPILFAMKVYLENLGYAVDCARDGKVARNLLQNGDYSLLISDLRLAPADQTGGLAMLTFARQSCQSIRTILLTAYGSPQVESQARALGIDLFLHKPTPLSQLATALRTLLDMAV